MTLSHSYSSIKVRRGSPDECWPWYGYVLRTSGYGRLRYQNKKVLAHRLVAYFEGMVGSPYYTKGELVLHTCDNRLCCNPRHLYVGSHKDNTADAMRRGRHRIPVVKSGAEHHNATLTTEEVAAIRAEYATGETTQDALAAKYNTHQATVYRIVHRKIYK